MTSKLVAPKLTATDEQVSTLFFAISLFEKSDATITPSLDEDGTMLLSVEEDGLTTHARFDLKGQIMGDWF